MAHLLPVNQSEQRNAEPHSDDLRIGRITDLFAERGKYRFTVLCVFCQFVMLRLHPLNMGFLSLILFEDHQL